MTLSGATCQARIDSNPPLDEKSNTRPQNAAAGRADSSAPYRRGDGIVRAPLRPFTHAIYEKHAKASQREAYDARANHSSGASGIASLPHTADRVEWNRNLIAAVR